MIKNILFDMGNVLIRFDRNLFLDRLDLSGEDKQILYREVFASVEWAQMDRGSRTEVTALESICRRIPERLHCAAEQLESLPSGAVLHKKSHPYGAQGLVLRSAVPEGLQISPVTIEELFVLMVKEAG